MTSAWPSPAGSNQSPGFPCSPIAVRSGPIRAPFAAWGRCTWGVAADLNATIEGFQRAELDHYGVETQQKAAAAWAGAVFAQSVVPVPASPTGPGLDHDELVRAHTTFESLAALPPAFSEMGAGGQDRIALDAYPAVTSIEHLHTVGTSPQMADAAALLLLGTHDCRGPGHHPRGRILAAATAAVNPVVMMLTAGQTAVLDVLSRTGLRPADVDVFEFAEAFAALCLRFRRDLDAGRTG